MKRVTVVLPIVGLVALTAILVRAADWPQWRGLHRDAKVADFKAPEKWPQELTPTWDVTVGEGDSTPSLVGDKLYVFARQDGNEILRCLDAASGKELWQDKYEAEGATGGARNHAGPRASPTIVDGKVVTLGVRGMLSCLDAETGKVLWRKDEFKSWPVFFVSSSPIVVDGMCIAQLGSDREGAIVAYDLASGEEKWKWTGGNPAYSSPVLMTLDGAKLVVALGTGKLVALTAADGKPAWELAIAGPPGGGRGFGRGPGGFGPRGPGGRGPGGRGPDGERGRGPGQGERGSRGVGEQREPQGAAVVRVAQGVFAQPQPQGERGQRGPGGRGFGGRGGRGGGGMTRFAATPIVFGDIIVYAGAGNALKAVKLEKEGDKVVSKELWTNSETPLSFNTPVLKDGMLFGVTQSSQFFCVDAQSGKTAWIGPRDTGGGYASVVDAGSVLLGITPNSGLVVIQPSPKEYTEIARIKVSESPVYAHLVVVGNRLFVKDQDSVALFSVE